MLRKNQEGHIRAERSLLVTAATSTRWTVRLSYSFQDLDHLYLVMSFMSGGGKLRSYFLTLREVDTDFKILPIDLLTLLIAKDIFPENFARFYVSTVLIFDEEFLTNTILSNSSSQKWS